MALPKERLPLTDHETTLRILDDVMFVRGDHREDYSPEHDDQKDSVDWHILFEREISRYLSKSEIPPRRALLNLAALAVAAVESMDRSIAADEVKALLRQSVANWKKTKE